MVQSGSQVLVRGLRGACREIVLIPRNQKSNADADVDGVQNISNKNSHDPPLQKVLQSLNFFGKI